MFTFFMLMLLLAVLTDNTNEVIAHESIVEHELATENQLANDVVSDSVLKN